MPLVRTNPLSVADDFFPLVAFAAVGEAEHSSADNFRKPVIVCFRSLLAKRSGFCERICRPRVLVVRHPLFRIYY